MVFIADGVHRYDDDEDHQAGIDGNPRRGGHFALRIPQHCTPSCGEELNQNPTNDQPQFALNRRSDTPRAGCGYARKVCQQLHC